MWQLEKGVCNSVILLILNEIEKNPNITLEEIKNKIFKKKKEDIY
jgi:hypothetical protein